MEEAFDDKLKDVLQYYNTVGCQCAFPRFSQIVSIDCTDTHDSFFVIETEKLINISSGYFSKTNIDRGSEITRQIWTCKKCHSSYEFAWSDFSIYVNRTYLKPLEIKATPIGSAPKVPIPLFMGLRGHSYPANGFIQTDLDSFINYLMEA